jgi:hypothetical protein
MTKIAGSGSISQRHGSGSISQRHGSADPDPDPPQNDMGPQHCFFLNFVLLNNYRIYIYIILQRKKYLF